MSNIQELQHWLAEHDFDGILIPHGDRGFNENPPDNERHLFKLLGFRGSSGLGLVLKDCALLFTDGRYHLQARQELSNAQLVTQPFAEWLGTHKNLRLAFDGWRHDIATIESWQKLAHLTCLAEHPLTQGIAPVRQNITAHPLSCAGISSFDKRQKLAHLLQEGEFDGMFICDGASLAWLFNIRGDSLCYNPIVNGCAFIKNDGIAIFCADAPLPHQDDDVTQGSFADLKKQNGHILLARTGTPYAFYQLLKEWGMEVTLGKDLSLTLRECKNETEVMGSRMAHLWDGIAHVHFVTWLYAQGPSSLREGQIADQLLKTRAQNKSFRSLSFATIAARDANGAIVHYQPQPPCGHLLKDGSVLLVDAGSQYSQGTTDATRTYFIGSKTPAFSIKHHYTLVLRALLKGMTAHFPPMTPASQLDAIIRTTLWQENLNYEHGTGHGVGSFLNVHEGIAIHKRNHAPLKEHMIFSIEPALYFKGRYGIRLENLVRVTKAEPMHQLECLTLMPYERQLILTDALTPFEIDAINAYHRLCYERLSPHLEGEEKEFLEALCAPL